MEEADELCDRVAIIDHGRILVGDTPERLKQITGAKTEIHLDLPETPRDLLATACLTFFGIHLTILLILAVGVALPLAQLELHRGQLLLDARDVGPSAGYYGCLVLAVAGLCSRKRGVIFFAITFVLALRLTWSTIHIPEAGRLMSADLAHLVAFPVGWLSHRLVAHGGENRR